MNPNVLPTNYSTGGHGLLNQLGFSSKKKFFLARLNFQKGSPNQANNEMANNPFFREMMKSVNKYFYVKHKRV